METYSLIDIINQLEKADKDLLEFSEIRATLIVNYCNPNRPHRHIANKDESVRTIMFKVLGWFENQLKEKG